MRGVREGSNAAVTNGAARGTNARAGDAVRAPGHSRLTLPAAAATLPPPTTTPAAGPADGNLAREVCAPLLHLAPLHHQPAQRGADVPGADGRLHPRPAAQDAALRRGDGVHGDGG